MRIRGFVAGLLAATVVASAGCATPPAPPRAAQGAPAPSPSPSERRRPDPHGSVGAFFATHFSPEALASVGQSARRGELAVPLALAVAAVAVRPFDHQIERLAAGTLGGHQAIGTAAQDGLVVASFGIGILRPRSGRSVKDEMFTQGESFALTEGMALGLKALTHRLRPDLSDRSSFPSAHTSAAFCAATLIERDAGPWFGVPAYALAVLTGYSRVESRRHFASDVFAGAALGTAAATIIDAIHFGHGEEGGGICGSRVRLEAGLVEGGAGLCLTTEF